MPPPSGEPYVRITLSDIYREVKELREEVRQGHEHAKAEMAEVRQKYVSKRAAYLALGLACTLIAAMGGIVALGDRLWA